LKRSRTSSPPCPCGSGLDYAGCCRPRHDGSRPAETAEALMRSRYSAYALHLPDYLLATWHADTRPARLDGLEDSRWLRLQVTGHTAGDVEDLQGTVEFKAWYSLNGRACCLAERSRFEKLGGRWLYRDGDVRTDAAE
jgi:SEC-C motif domain protein